MAQAILEGESEGPGKGRGPPEGSPLVIANYCCLAAAADRHPRPEGVVLPAAVDVNGGRSGAACGAQVGRPVAAPRVPRRDEARAAPALVPEAVTRVHTDDPQVKLAGAAGGEGRT